MRPPSLLQDPDHRQGLLQEEDVYPGLEILSGGHGVHVVVELLDGPVLQLPVQIAEENGLVGEEFPGILTVALGHALDKLHGGFLHRLVLLVWCTHNTLLLPR